MNWIRHALNRKQIYSDLSEEMRLHLEEKTEFLIEGGMSRAAAQQQAKREFGNSLLLEERGREVWLAQPVGSIWADIKYAFRQMNKSRSFACITILVLSLGIGPAITIFSLTDAVLIKPLPYNDPSELVAVYETNELESQYPVSYPDFLDWDQDNHVFRSMAAYSLEDGFTLRTLSHTERVSGVSVSSSFFHTIGVIPVMGRDFHKGESSHAVLLSYAAWKTRFASRPEAIGESVTLDNATRTIVGVLPATFQFAPARAPEFWALLSADSSMDVLDACKIRRSCHNFSVIARLRTGVSIQTARSEMSLVAQRLEQKYPDSNRDQKTSIISLNEVVVGNVRHPLFLLMGGASLLLLISCVNVSSLLLVRAESRRHEIAVRAAIGASPIRLMRQLTTESLVLAFYGGTTGLIYAYLSIHLLPKFIPQEMLVRMPYLCNLKLNGHSMMFAAAISVLSALAFTASAALRLPMSDVWDGLTGERKGAVGKLSRCFANTLIVLQLGVAMVVLVWASLLGKGLYRLRHVDTGVQPEHLRTLQLEGTQSQFATTDQRLSLEREVLTEIMTIPGVEAVGVSSQLPFGEGGTSWFRVVGRRWGGEHNEAVSRRVSPAYFRALQAPLLEGRNFDESDDESRPLVAIINHTMARKYFLGEDPVEKEISFLSPLQSPMRIVGVVSDISEGRLDGKILPAFYTPFDQQPSRSFSLVVRTQHDGQPLSTVLVAAIKHLDKNVAVYAAEPMQERIDDEPSVYIRRSSTWLAAGFACIALLLGAVGLYGATAYAVTSRNREIAVRMALGARRRAIYRLVLKEAGLLTASGLLLGLAGSVVTAPLLHELLFDVGPWDIGAFCGAVLLLVISMLAVSYLPARRAATLQPVEILRSE